MIYLMQAQTGTHSDDYSDWIIGYTTTEKAAQEYVELLKKESKKIPKDQYNTLKKGWNKYDPEGHTIEFGGIQYFYYGVEEVKFF